MTNRFKTRPAARPSAAILSNEVETLEPRCLLSSAAGGVAKGFAGNLFRPATDRTPSVAQSTKARAAFTRSHAAYTNYFATRKNKSTPFATATPTGLSPTQIRNAYGINAIAFASVTGDGSGQTIAIIDAYDDPKFVSSSNAAGYAASDLFAFNAQFGLPQFGTAGNPTFTKVDQTGGTNYPVANANWAAEIALDVEWAHAIAPKANLVLVEAGDNSGQLDIALDYARNLPGVSAISMSYGADEYSEQTLEDGNYLTPSGHAGVTFLASTGDTGANGSFPAYSSNVVAVGGTVFTFASGVITGETGWSGSGGGISAYESQPDYQTNRVPQSTTQRTTPDVGFVAGSGVSVYDSYNNGSATPWWNLGGTSLSSPCWAGLMAITNQGRSLLGLASLNGRTQTLPRLYSLSGASYSDITSGNNGYDAVAGYDLVTGRGTPKAATLVPQLAGGVYTGVAYIDANASGSYVSGETLLSGVTVYNDANNNGAFDAGETSSVTAGNGVYSLDLTGGLAMHLRVTGSGPNFPLFDAVNGTTAFGTFTNNLALFPSVFTSTTGYRVKASGTKTLIYTNSAGTGTPMQVEQGLVTTGLTFNGASTNDTFVIDATAGNPLPNMSSAFVATTGTDTIQVIAASGGTTASYANDAIKIGTAGFGLNSLTHSDVENLTFTGGAGNDTVNLISGGQQPVYTGNGGSDTINVTGRAFAPTYNLGGDGTNVTLNANSGATVSFVSNETLAALNVSGASTVALTDTGDVLRTKALSIDTANGAAINLGVNALLLDYTGSSPLTTIRNYVTAGYAAGAFTGPGLRPSTANAAKRLGYGEAGNALGLSGSATTTYLGQTVDATTVIVRYTYAGDADLDGGVSINDFNRFATAFGNATGALWTGGDFDYDNGVSIIDFNNLATNFGAT